MLQLCFDLKNKQAQSYRSKISDEKQSIYVSKLKNQNGNQVSKPLKIKFIQMIGLKNYLIDKFVFARKQSKYRLQTGHNNKNKFVFPQKKYQQIHGYTQKCDIIDLQHNFIPLVHFKRTHSHSLITSRLNKKKSQLFGTLNINFQQLMQQKQDFIYEQDLTIIYSHGNYSDLEDSYQFISLMIMKYKVNFIVYDYTGYGNQCRDRKLNFNEDKHTMSDESLCDDLRKVIQWSKVPLNKIILWGFSLGCHPTISVASQLKLNSVVIQSPFASLYSLINFPSSHLTDFKQDLFNNLFKIQSVKCDILLLHSTGDSLIPIEHSRLLMKRFQHKLNPNNLRFIQLSNFNHNQMHLLFIHKKVNLIQTEVERFLKEANQKIVDSSDNKIHKSSEKSGNSFSFIHHASQNKKELQIDHLKTRQTQAAQQQKQLQKQIQIQCEQKSYRNLSKLVQIQSHLALKSFHLKKSKYIFNPQQQ